MSASFRTSVIRSAALLVALLFPAQALAHCGVPLAGVRAHQHHPGARTTSAAERHGGGGHAADGTLQTGRVLSSVEHLSARGMDAALRAATAGSCTLTSSVFTVPRSIEPGIDRDLPMLPQALLGRTLHAPLAAIVPVTVLRGPPSFTASASSPLRI